MWMDVMLTRFLQAFAACLTVVLYLMRRHGLTHVCPAKCSSFIMHPSLRDPRRSRASTASSHQHLERSASAAWGARGVPRSPRCKRDPVIEDFAVPPHE